MAELKWTAQYNDGTYLKQISPDGTKNAYTDIDRSKLKSFILRSQENVYPEHVVLFDNDGEKLVWTRRIRQTMGEDPQTFHIVGKKGEFISAVSEDTGIVITRHNFIDDGLFYEVSQ